MSDGRHWEDEVTGKSYQADFEDYKSEWMEKKWGVCIMLGDILKEW